MFNRKKASDAGEAARRENFAKGSFIGYDLPAPKRPERPPPRGVRASLDPPKSPRQEAPKSPRSSKAWDEAAAAKNPAPAPRLEPPSAAGDRIRSTSPSRSGEAKDAKVTFAATSGNESLDADGPVLEVLVSGGGPCGLIFSCLLAGYAGDRCHIRVYEARVKKAGDKIVWKGASDGNTRREQVVTLQNDVTRCLPKEMRDYLFKRIDEEAWPSSRNIPIREVEDQMLEYAQMPQFKGIIEVVPEQLTDEKMKELNGTFDILVGADGSRSFVRTWSGIQTRVLGTDKAMGVAYECTPAPLSQATNILLTVSQTRYLLNSHKGERGFLNLRLEESEWEELAKEGRMETRPFPIAARNSMLWNVILDGLRLFDIPEATVKAIMPIEIQLTYAAYFMTEIDNFKTTVPTGADRPRAFVIGDAAFRVHFWPGRGLNSAIKGAIALARASYWAYDREHKGGKRLRPVNNWDFSRFEGFMAMLRAREEEGRSRPVTEISVEDAVLQGLKEKADWVALREKFKDTMLNLRGRLEDRPDWPHPKISDKDIDDVFIRLSPLTINTLHYSGTWPLAEMAGEEVDPRMLFQNPSGETAESRIVRQNIAKPQVSRGK